MYFKNRLDKFWANVPLMYNFEAEYEILSWSEKRTIKYNDDKVEQNIMAKQCQSFEDQ